MGLPEGWVEANIGDIAQIVSGGTPKSNDESNFSPPGTEIAWLTPADLSGYKKKEISFGRRDLSQKGLKTSSAKLMPKGAVLFSSRAPIGYVVIAENEISTNQGFKSFVFISDVSPSYAYFYLRSIRSLAESLGTGTTFKELSSTAAKKLPFILPPLNEQIRISNKLDSLLAKVETAQSRLEKIPVLLKRFRQAVLAAATSGELTREWREKNEVTTAEMLKNFISPKKPARYKSRNLGYIQGVKATSVGKPASIFVDSWQWIPLVDIAEMGTGHTPSRSKPEYWGGDVNWVGIKDSRRHHTGTIFETEQKTNQLGLANSAARLLPKNTVCISRTASVGYVIKLGTAMATSQDFVTWTPTSVLSADWLKWLFVAEKESLFRFGKGSTHTTIYFPEWLSLYVALPPLEEQTEIVRRVESLFAQADKVESQYKAAKTRLDKLTQSILAKAFRGELVPQDPNDEPASELLKRIQTERELQVKTKPKRARKKSAVSS